MNRFHDRPKSGRPLILAHRGDSSHAPENTLEAGRRGFEAGADGWELDIRLSRDDVPVVIHDASLSRTTDVARKFADDPRRVDGFLVADFDWGEIQGLDAGSWFVDPMGGHRSASAFGTLDAMPESDRLRFASGKIRVPSLAEALQLTVQLDWLVNVELKTFPEGNAATMIEKVVELIRSMDAGRRVLLSSFQHADLTGLLDSIPDAVSGVLTTTPLRNAREYVRDHVRAHFYHPSAEVLGAGSDLYRRSPDHANLWEVDFPMSELPTFVYTVNDPILAKNLGKIGVAGLFTDDPAKVLEVWESLP